MLKKLGFRLPDIFVVHSMINDAQGRKMSKSKKNAAGLTRLLDLFGSPPLRLWVLANFSLEKNISFSEENIISF